MSGLDIHSVYLQSARFWQQLESRKRALPGAGLEWYAYCSLANFEHFDKLLAEGPRDFAALAGGGPLLDIGCADGDLAFFLESLGLGPVHAVDSAGTNCNGMRGVRALGHALGSRVEVLDIDVDASFSLPARPYSCAFFLGLLYHLKNPFHVLETLALYARTCLMSTRIMRVFPGGGPAAGLPVAYLLDAGQLNADATNFWVFTEAGLRRLAHRSGWHVERFYATGAPDSDPHSLDRDERAFCLLRSRRWLANITLGDGWHEESSEGWRWTARRFSFTLPEDTPDETPADLHFLLPESSFHQTGPVTLRAGDSSYRAGAPGDHVFRIVRPSGERHVQCELDRAVAPSAADERELGVVVREVAVPAP